jgi:hypothetical protein
MDVAFRPARSEDLEPGGQILQRAILDLRQRHGVALPQPLGPPADPGVFGPAVREAVRELAAQVKIGMADLAYNFSRLALAQHQSCARKGPQLPQRPALATPNQPRGLGSKPDRCPGFQFRS